MTPRPAKRAKLSETPKRTVQTKNAPKSQKKKLPTSARKTPLKPLRELVKVDDTPFVIKQGHRMSQCLKKPAGFRLQYHPYFKEDVAYAIQLNGDSKHGFAEWDKLSYHKTALVPESEIIDKDTEYVPFKVGDLIYVSNDAENEDCKIKDWIGHILQIAALQETQNVWVRVWWFLRPEDLPGGRQPHHGDDEIFPSNCMEIIDIGTINYVVECGLLHIVEDELPLDTAGNLFWRQTYDFVQDRLEPRLAKHCKCKQYVNVTDAMMNCSNATCAALLHEQCILDAAVKRAYRRMHAGESVLHDDVGATSLSATKLSSSGIGSDASEGSRATGIFDRVRSYLSASRGSSAKSQNDSPRSSEHDITRTGNLIDLRTSSSKTKLARKLVPRIDPSVAKQYFDAQLDTSLSGIPRLHIKELKSGNKTAWEEDVQCLVCGNTIERVYDAQ